MSAFTWICVFLLVGLLNSPVNGDDDNDNDNDNDNGNGNGNGNGNLGFFWGGENADNDNDNEEDDRAISNHPAVGEIQYLGRHIQECLNAKNIPCLSSFYANDVIVVPNGYPSFQGIDQLKSTLKYRLNAVKHPATHIEPLGPKGEYMLEVHPYDNYGPSGITKGKTALIWKRFDDGQYRIIFEMSNDKY